MTDTSAMLDSVGKFLASPLGMIASRAAIGILVLGTGWIGGTIYTMDTRLAAQETASREIRSDVNAIDYRSQDRAKVNDQFQESILLKMDVVDNKVDALNGRVSEIFGILSQMQRQSVAKAASLDD